MAKDDLKPSNKGLPKAEGVTIEDALLHLHSKDHAESAGLDNPYEQGKGFREFPDREGELESGVISGYSDLVQLREDLLVRITKVVTDRDREVTYQGENWLKLEFWIAGKESLVLQDHGQIDFEGRWCFIYWHPEGMSKGEWVSSGEGIVVTIYCRPSYIEEMLGDQFKLLPNSIQQLALNKSQEWIFEILPLTQSMVSAVTDLTTLECTGRLRHLYVEAKTLTLFTSAMEILINTDADSEHSAIKRLTKSEIRRVQGVRDYILKNLSNPPKIADLSRQAGINQQKLQQIFQALYIDTIADFCFKNRMAKARNLLEQNEMTVTQIALSAGYEFANNFSTAFKRHYGILPKTYQNKFRANIKLLNSSDT